MAIHICLHIELPFRTFHTYSYISRKKILRKHGGKLQRIIEVQAHDLQGGLEEVPERQSICSFIDLENIY